MLILSKKKKSSQVQIFNYMHIKMIFIEDLFTSMIFLKNFVFIMYIKNFTLLRKWPKVEKFKNYRQLRIFNIS